MAKNKEPRPTYAISVVGLSGTEKEKGNCGVVLHRGDDGLECRIQVIEQTEFIDDQTFLPHRSTNLQPYTKRAANTKLQSAEKLMYICTDQLGLEQDFDQKQMPDGKLNIDGFVLCLDAKKPIIIAATKCDECVEQYLREVQTFVTGKKNLMLVETSARASVNVELCFNALIQQMDKTRDKFEKLIVQTVRDYHTSWRILRQEHIKRRREDYLTKQTPWYETDHLDKTDDRRVPFDILKTMEGERIYQNHVQHLISEKRRLEMKEKFKKTLERVHFISPGQPWEEVMCFVMEDEAYKYITESDRRDVYSRHQQEIVERAKEEFQEMLFEHAELFYDLDLNATPSCDKMSEIHAVLNEEPRYRALQKLATDRESLLLKHIGFVYHPTKETCLSGTACIDLKVEQVLANRLVQLDHGRSNIYYNSANIDKVNLCLVGREGLAQELANEIRAQSTDDEYTLDGKIYELDLLPVDVNSGMLLNHSWISNFKPHGFFCVFSSIESLNYIGDRVSRIRAEIAQSRRDRKFNESQIKQALRAVLEGLKHNFDMMSPMPSIKDLSETDLRIVIAGQPGQCNTLILDKIIGDRRRRIQRAFLAEVQDVIPVQLVAITDSQADFFENEAIKELMTEGEHIATEITAKFTALYSLSQYHRQTEVFTPFFNEVLEKKNNIESFFMFDNSRDGTGTSEDVFPQSPHRHSPAYQYYPDSEDDGEGPPPYSPIGDDVQLLPNPSERKYRIDLEGNEYPVHSTPAGDHERNHKVPPPVKPKPNVLPKPNVKKLDPNLLRTIEAGMRTSRWTRGPMLGHGDDLEASDNYAEPADTLLKSKGFSDDIYAVPEDAQSRSGKIRNSFGVLALHGDEENGFDSMSKSQGGRRPSKYKHRSKILFSKTKAYHRRVHSDVSDDESGPATQKKKKGRGNRGSEEDPLLSPVDPWKGGIDNPAITSDPEQDDKKMKKKKPPKTKEPKKNK
ncbi:hypothetical protein cypCar_00022708 [Cyprinus carpio]|nr:hypothetical protein cypCar_00022708 [Cyprinus carpio]